MSVSIIETRPPCEVETGGHGEETHEDVPNNLLEPQQRNSPKVHKRRWLVLSAMVFMFLAVGIHRCLGPIIDIVDKSVGMSLDNYNLMTQVSLYIIVGTVLGMAQVLDRLGIRKTAYLVCFLVACASCLKSVCFFDERYLAHWIRDNRFYILILSEAFVGLAGSISFCIPAKVASVWFPTNETTLALVILNCGFTLGIALSVYSAPILIKSPADMYKLSYLFPIFSALVSLIVVTCVTEPSQHKEAPLVVGAASTADSTTHTMPSNAATPATDPQVPPVGAGLRVMLTERNCLLAIVTLALNLAVPGVLQLDSEAILKSHNYSNTLCGTLVADSYFFGTIFMLMGGVLIDKSSERLVEISRITCLVCGSFILINNINVTLPNNKSIILVTNTLAALGVSLMYPAMLQVCLRSASTILPQATIAAVCTMLELGLSGVLINFMNPLKRLTGDYQTPLIVFGSLLLCANILYAATFRQPNQQELHRKLRLVLEGRSNATAAAAADHEQLLVVAAAIEDEEEQVQ